MGPEIYQLNSFIYIGPHWDVFRSQHYSRPVRTDLPFTDMTQIKEKRSCAVFIFTTISEFTIITKRTDATDMLRLPMRACIGTIGRGYLPVA
jgi:hypothetical protein